MATFKITFDDPAFAPVDVEAGAKLCDVLDGTHSPVFFGCKSGNCGTCLVELDETSFATAPPPDELEQEYLEFAAKDKPHARLACQLTAQCNLHLKYLQD